MSAPACRMKSAIAEHFAGTISPKQERRLRLHLPECEVCRTIYDRHLLFAAIDPSALEPRERLMRGLGLSRHARPGTRRLIAVCAAAAAVGLIFVLRSTTLHAPDPSSALYAARGAAHPPPSRILVFRVRAGGSPAPIGEELAPDDELAFGYENLGGYPRLLVFGVDETERVYWYLPGWREASDDPIAIPIATDPGRHEIGEAVRHALAGTKLTLYAVFSSEPLSVRAAEAAITQRDRRSGELPLPGTLQQQIALKVVR